MSSFRLDSTYRRPGAGRVVVGGSPLRLFRLSAGGVRVMAAIENDAALPKGHQRLTDHLVNAGVLHPVPDVSVPAPAVTIVVPSLGQEVHMRTEMPVIVVDDGSEPPLTAAVGQQLLRLPMNCGPGAARNEGLRHVSTELVAFVDSDVELPDDGSWLAPLLAHFSDPLVVAVAPRVRSTPGPGVLERYDAMRSPLDLGDEPGRVAPGSRVSYVPAAVLVCRTEAVRELGGFDEQLRYGEDVDLVWRFVAAGKRVRYEPAAVVHHRPRPDAVSWLRQREGYGSSATPLAERHQGALAPLRMSGWSAAVWALLALRRPVLAAAVAGGTTVALQRKLTDLPKQESALLAARGHLHAGKQFAAAVMRAWWPLALLAAVVSKRLRPALVAAAVVPPLIEWSRGRGRGLDPLRYTALRIADDMAYGAGVWRGAWHAHRADALVPSFRNWPPRAGD